MAPPHNATRAVIVAGIILALGFSSASAQHKTLGPGSCGRGKTNCHDTDFKWWDADPHSASIDALYDDLELAEKYAEIYGIGAANLFSGSAMCMTCHGTVISGAEDQTTDFGVSCEGCHGPGEAYLGPHAEGDVSQGRNRSGYVDALPLGLNELANMDVRADVCVGCHYVAEVKLLRTGHSNGAKFNYIKGTRTVAKHWDRSPTDDELSKGPFKALIKKIAPSASIVISAPTPAPASASPLPPAAPPIQARRNADPVISSRPSKPITLPPFPAISDSASVQELLLIVARRLDMLAQKVGSR
ncbi:MAG: multiheme c-type cytochrome [Candidatus Zixiibacteriota bacterium]